MGTANLGGTLLIMKKDGKQNKLQFVIIALLCALLPRSLLAQEPLLFVAEQHTVAYFGATDRTMDIAAGEVIAMNGIVSYGAARYQSGKFRLILAFGEPPNNLYYVCAKHFRPLNTADVFGDDIFIDYPVEVSESVYRQAPGPSIATGDTDAMWVPSYYANVLRSQNRESLRNFVSEYVFRVDHEFVWYDFTSANIQHGRAMFYNSAIKLGLATHLALRKIRRTEFGYIVDCVVSANASWTYSTAIFPESGFWSTFSRGEALTLYLHLDGDYLDIYVNGSGMFLGTFMRVEREFIAQYQRLILTNTVDLTNVQWPQRAGH